MPTAYLLEQDVKALKTEYHWLIVNVVLLIVHTFLILFPPVPFFVFSSLVFFALAMGLIAKNVIYIADYTQKVLDSAS